MAITIIYDVKTGIIHQSVNGLITKQAQIDEIKALGRDLLEAPDGTDGSNAIIDLDSKSILSILPQVPVPNLTAQLVAALIKKGVVDAGDFHPSTVAELDVALVAANIAPTKGSAAP